MALPGVTTVLKDRFYTLTRTDAPQGPRVLAIASRTTADLTADGQGVPVANYDPYAPRSEADCIAAFGQYSFAHRAYLELVSAGSTQPYIVAIPSGTLDTQLYDITASGVFTRAFDAAESALPDIIVPYGRGGSPTEWQQPATPGDDLQFGFVADNTTAGSLTNNLAQLVANQCKLITDRSHPCFAVMGIKPYAGTATNATEVITAGNIAVHMTNANIVDHNSVAFGVNGQYLSVVGGEINVAGYPQNNADRSRAGDLGYANGACTYAGYLTQTASYQAPTGKQIPNVTGLRYQPTRAQQQGMIDRGNIPIVHDYNRVPTWVDGLTFSKSTSDYTRITTMRIAFTAINGIRVTAQSFVGEAATLQTKNALDTAIRSMLRGMTQTGALLDSDFTVTYLPRESKAIIDLVLRPVFELRNIEISVSVDI
jgi:hypothetical protein